MNRKLLKFIFSPRKFFIDMYKKRLIQGQFPSNFHAFRRVSGENKYSVVTAVYGVEKYLDKYFTSFENQSLKFSDHIELIMVDDGSVDRSAEIIKKWVKKYPDNISYIKKENEGQASARNLGMKFVKYDWVTFIDSDDFVDINYFLEVDRIISANQNVALVSCNFIFYMEKGNRFSDTHPLRYRFKNKQSINKVKDLGKNIQLSASSAFFRTKIISNNKLKMDPRIKPSFEDAHFIGKYLLELKNHSVAFVKEANYYYRKRDDKTSTLDNVWSSKKNYYDKLKFGSIDLLETAYNQSDEIPEYIQRMVLYDLIWYFRALVNNKEKLSFLSFENKNAFKECVKSIFQLIDEKVIHEFELVACNAFYKAGWLNLFKNNVSQIYEVKIDGYDSCKKLVKLSYFFGDAQPIAKITCEGESLSILYEKVREHSFIDDVFVSEKIIWVSIPNKENTLSITLNDIDATLLLGSSKKEREVSFTEIISHFESPKINERRFSYGIRVLRGLARLSIHLPGYQDAWVFIDRDIQADDNAEHLYRYVKKQNPELNLRFLIRKNSKDWKRLKKEGFNLIPFASIRHMIILFNAKHLISSHADNYVVNYPPHSWFKGILCYKYTFLQHGVTKDDLSNWLNKKPIDIFVTASEREYLSIAGKKNAYKFSAKEVVLTGFARHDRLLAAKSEINLELRTKTLLIMPTWRQNLVGKTHWMSNSRSLNKEFYSSQFAFSWKSFLNSKVLEDLAIGHKLNVVFFPHVNITPYLEWFNVPAYITTMEHYGDKSIQNLFLSSSLMITDYSSVAFEMAYLKKPVIYYQFDSEKVFGGEHLTRKGYFDYEKDGFGPVCNSEEELLENLRFQLEESLMPSDKYISRMDNTFKYKDGNCCKRIYKAILDLEKPQ